MRIIKRLLLYCSPLSLTLACHAADLPATGVPAQGPQIMLYFRQPLGGPGGHRVYGLRLDQGSSASGMPNPSAAAPLRRREILSFEIGQHTGMHLELGHRLFWDVSRGELALGSRQPTLPFRLPAATAPAPQPARPHP